MKSANNSELKILEKKYTIKFMETKTMKSLVFVDNDFLKVFQSDVSNETYESILESWLKSEAKKIISSRTEELAKEFNFEFKRIAIKSQRTRWGSCSSKGNLNFNWQLMLTSQKCLDYVIIHELAHTKQMNHSIHFWKLVEDCMNDYKVAIKELRNFEKELFSKQNTMIYSPYHGDNHR